MGDAYSSWGQTNVLYATSFVCLGAKAKFRLRNPKVLVAFDDISEICWPQSRSSVMVIPRYLADWTCSNICWYNEYSNLICLSGRCRDTLIEWHLATLNFICQSASHCASRSRSSCKIRQSEGEYMFLYRTQSSANKRTDDLMLSGRSLMNTKKRTGPRTEPWGTPDKTGTGSDSSPSSTTCCERLESHELIHLCVDPLIP